MPYRDGVLVGLEFNGTVVWSILKDSISEKSDQIFTGDVVLSVNGIEVHTLVDISRLIADSRKEVVIEFAEP